MTSMNDRTPPDDELRTARAIILWSLGMLGAIVVALVMF